MLKYLNTQVTFSEVPDEITLCINITGCKVGCRNCHSSYLAEDIGNPLIYKRIINGKTVVDCSPLSNLIDANTGITCVCLMGGDSNPEYINILGKSIKLHHLKSAWYSGRQELAKEIDLKWFDFLKLGPYIEELGPLNSKTTNQRMYKVVEQDNNYELVDITDKFWKE